MELIWIAATAISIVSTLKNHTCCVRNYALKIQTGHIDARSLRLTQDSKSKRCKSELRRIVW